MNTGRGGRVGRLQVLAMVAAVAAPAGLSAQEWVTLDGPSIDTWQGVYDARRQRFVRIGSFDDDLMEWNGVAWNRVSTPVPPFFAPVHRNNFASCYDSLRGRVYMMGGRVSSVFGDTWFWDGIAWSQLPSLLGPPRREGALMAYDAARDRVVLFGGQDTVQLRDVWEYDGFQWTQITAAGTPTWSATARMAYDAARARCVVLGAATFTYNGTSWAQAAADATSVSTRLTYDPVRQRVVAYRADQQAQFRDWNGVAWTTTAPPQLPAVADASLYFDSRLGKVVFGAGSLGGGQLAWDGATLQRIDGYYQGSGQAWFHDAARGRSVAFSGLRQGSSTAETWTWDGRTWTMATPVHVPPPRTNACATFDTVRNVGLLFGGSSSVGSLGDLWSWDGSDWTLLANSGPPGRILATMAFDTVRGRAVLFGGLGASGPLRDVWEWDGAAWIQPLPAVSPPFGLGTMAYDPVRARTVLFLGVLSPPQTWEWDGTSWTQRFPTVSPLQSGLTSATFDPVRGKVVLVGPSVGYGVWEFDGATWSRRNDLPDYLGTAQPAVVFDVARGIYSMLSGKGLFELRSQASALEYFDVGCGEPQTVLMPAAHAVVGEARFGCDLAIGSGYVAMLGLATSAGSTPLGGGCTLHLGTVVASSLAAAGADGIARFPLPIPANPALVGAQVFAQGGGLDGLGQLRVSQGLRIVVGD